MWQTHITKKT